MFRYFLQLSYIGTAFRGLQKNLNKSSPIPLDHSTVQSSLELALARFSPVNDIQVVLSSRTDAGVHALHTAVHVDLERASPEPYNAEYLTSTLNRSFANDKLEIRVLSTQVVPDTFHCRYNAKSRTYLYRIAIAKEYRTEVKHQGRANFLNFVTVEELHRCWFLATPTISIDKIKEAAPRFLGRHDFRSFMSAKTKGGYDHPAFTWRAIDTISIQPGKALITSATKKSDLYQFWDIQIKGRSFLHKQIRRIVGCLVSYGRGTITDRDIYEMLTIPSKYSWNSKISVAPPHGLYLANVEYDPKEYEFQNEPPERVAEEEGHA